MRAKGARYIIYGLVDPVTEELRYVGRGCSLQRPDEHTYPSYLSKDDSFKGRWLKALGIKPRVVIIQELNVESDLNQAEIYWISHLRSLGCPLTNLTDGGGGHLGYRKSPETVKKIAEAQRGKFVSEETRKKMSLAKAGYVPWNKGMPRTEEQNIAHSRKIGGTSIKNQYGEVFQTISEASRKLSVPRSSISKSLREHKNTASGYIFTRI